MKTDIYQRIEQDEDRLLECALDEEDVEFAEEIEHYSTRNLFYFGGVLLGIILLYILATEFQREKENNASYSYFMKPVCRQFEEHVAAREEHQSVSTEELSCYVPPEKRFRITFLVNREKRLSVCLIPKNMSTLLNKLFCLLLHPIEYQRTYGGIMGKQRTDRTCDGEIPYISSFKKIAQPNESNWQHFAFIREPQERFLSAYMHVCTVTQNGCFGCDKKDIECVMVELRKEINHWLISHHVPLSRNMEMIHFVPQTWNCDFFSDLDQIQLIPYSSNSANESYNKLFDILGKANVSSKLIERLSQELETGTTIHATNHLSSKPFYAELMKTPTIQRHLKEIYYFDYVLLGYPLPSSSSLSN